MTPKPLEIIRRDFEAAISLSRWKNNTPLGVMTINGVFDHYMDPDTDTMWLGFALAVRYQERLNQERSGLLSLLANQTP